MRRDFTKSNKEFFSKNKIALISVAVFLLIGIIVFAIFGMNGNFEIKGYTEFSVTVSEAQSKDYVKMADSIGEVVDMHGAKYDTFLVSGEGDNTHLIIRYTKKVSADEQAKINQEVATALNINESKISTHTFVEPVVNSIDYVYTATAILLLVVIATIFAYIRYNGASAISIVISNFLATLGFISIGSILRLSIGLSYFAMLVILNVLVIYCTLTIFESMHKTSWLANNEYETALTSAIKDSKVRFTVLGVAIMLLGLLFVLMAPITIKYVALNILFIPVVVLATAWYVVPFVWSALITGSKKREYKVKATKEEK